MATSGNTIALALEIDDKGTATIKNFAGQYEAAMNKVKASTTAVGSVMQRLGGFSSSVGARFSGLIRTLTSLKSLLLGGLGIYSITSVLKDFVSESNNADRATVGLITSLKATGRYTAEYAKKLLDLSSAYQATSTFGDEAIQDTMKMLATFKKISDDQIPRATRAIMDISTLMGTDMASAARLVGRASEGMAEGLSRVGIVIDDDVAKSGDFTKILDAIEAKVHGQSEELRKTGYGGLVAFGNIIGDVKEKLGDLIKSAIYPFVEAMVDGVNDINNNLAEFAANDDFEQRIISIQEKMRDWAVVALESVLKIKQSIGGLVKWIEQHPTIVEMGIVGYFLWGKKGIAGAAGVGVLASSLDRMKATWKGVMSGKVGLWDWILMDREEAEKTIADMNVYVKKSADEIDRLAASGTISAQSARELKEELQGISSVDLDTLTAQPDMFDNLVQGLIDKLNNMKLVAGKSGIDVGKSIGEGISGGVGEAVEDTNDKIKDIANSVDSSELTAEMQQALDDYYTAQEKVSDRIMELKSSETDYQLYLLDKEIDAFADAGVDKARLDELYQLERQKIMVGGVKDTIAQERELYQEYWESMAGDIKAAMSDTLVAMWEGETEKIGDIWDELWHRVKKSYADIAVEGISDAFSGVLDWMGLDSLSKAFKTTKTPPNLEVLDNQYGLQKTQYDTQKAILKALGGQPEEISSSLTDGISNIFDLFGKNSAGSSESSQLDGMTMDTSQMDMTEVGEEMSMLSDSANGASSALQGMSQQGNGFSSWMSSFMSGMSGSGSGGSSGMGGFGSMFGMGGSGSSGGGGWGSGSGWGSLVGAAPQAYDMWNRDYTGMDRWSGSVTGGLEGASKGAQVGQQFGGGYGAAIGAIIGGVYGNIAGFLGGEEAEREAKNMERAEDYIKEYQKIVNTTYDDLTDMMLDFDEMLEAKNIDAMENLGIISQMTAAIMQQFAVSASRAKAEADTFASVSSGTFAMMTMQLENAAASMPEQAEQLGKMREQMEKLFVADIFEDFEDGLLSSNDAIEKLTRQGMSQLEAQTALFGEDYNELIITMNGSIPVIDGSAEAFNDLREQVDELQGIVDDLPDSLEEVKQKLTEILYVVDYLINVTQSVVNFSESLSELPAIISTIQNTEDFDEMVAALKDLEDVAAEASSTLWQLAEVFDYIGAQNMAGLFENLSTLWGRVTAIIAVVRMGAEAFGVWDEMVLAGLQIWKTFLVALDALPFFDLTEAIEKVQEKIDELNGTYDDSKTQIELWREEIEDMEIGDVFSDIADALKDAKDIINDTDFGTWKNSADSIIESLQYALLEIERIKEEMAEDVTIQFNVGQAQQTLLDAALDQIEALFDAILDRFDDAIANINTEIANIRSDLLKFEYSLADTIEEKMAALPLLVQAYQIQLADIDAQLTDLWNTRVGTSEMWGTEGALDNPEAYLEDLQSLQDLVIARYETEAEMIKEVYGLQIEYWESVRDAYSSLAKQVEDIINDIKTSGANPAPQIEQVENIQDTIAGLESQIESETDQGEKANLYADLAEALTKYLSMAETLYQRPSNEYKAIYDYVMGRLAEIQGEAEQQVSYAEQQIIDLQAEMLCALNGLAASTIGKLEWIRGEMEKAREKIREQEAAYKAKVEQQFSDISNTAINTGNIAGSTAWAATKLTNLETLFKERFPLASFWSGLSKLGGEDNNIWTPQATGIDYVPRDNYPAMLHKGEAVVRARENKTVNVPINFSISVQGGSGKQIVADIEREIKWGKLGQVIKDRVKYAA